MQARRLAATRGSMAATLDRLRDVAQATVLPRNRVDPIFAATTRPSSAGGTSDRFAPGAVEKKRGWNRVNEHQWCSLAATEFE